MAKKEDKYFIYDEEESKSPAAPIRECVYRAKLQIYQMLGILCHPKAQKEKKYKVVICAIFKNEAPYLREWIEFHRIVGVEHFYLYNNNSTDNYLEILAPYINAGLIDLIDWPKQQSQMEAYSDCVERFKVDCRWIGFIDLDEFVLPIDDDTIYDFLSRFEKTAGAVVLPWQQFGSSGLINREMDSLVCESFYSCWRKHRSIGKCFYNTAYEIDFQDPRNKVFHHFLITHCNGIANMPANVFGRRSYPNLFPGKGDHFPAQINHYFSKSFDEYMLKCAKGDVLFQINPHDEDYFYAHEKNCVSTDSAILKYMVRLKRSMEKAKD